MNKILKIYIFSLCHLWSLFCVSDVNECVRDNGGCSDICINTPGSFRCECESGFKLGNDERTCEGMIIKYVVLKFGNVLFRNLRKSRMNE